MSGKDGLSPEDELYLREVLGESTASRAAGRSAEEKVQELQAQSGRTSFVRRVLRPASRDEKNWNKGARGERVAAEALSRLPTGWWVFHDLQVGSRGANIDHLVVGPSGIFTINTKLSTGNVWVGGNTFMANGHRTDYVRNSRWEAERVGRLLTAASGHPFTAMGVIAVVAPRITIKAPPDDVAVVSVKRLTSWLRSQPIRLTPSGVVEVVARADKPATWQPHKAEAAPTTRPAAAAAEPVAQPLPPTGPPPPEAAEGPAPDAGPCRCGGTLGLRRRRKDGAPFYGCSEFPRCHLTRPTP